MKIVKKPFTLIAHSMGGLISTLFAYHNSEMVKRMILCAPCLCPVLPLPPSFAITLTAYAEKFGYKNVCVPGTYDTPSEINFERNTLTHSEVN